MISKKNLEKFEKQINFYFKNKENLSNINEAIDNPKTLSPKNSSLSNS